MERGKDGERFQGRDEGLEARTVGGIEGFD